MVELVEQKKDHLGAILRIQNYLLECGEIKSQIREKRRAVEATQYNSGDLGSVLSLQRRLSTMEAALVVLEPRLVELQQEGELLANTHPAQALEVLLQFEEISEEWEALKRTLQGCEDSLTVASRSGGGREAGAGGGGGPWRGAAQGREGLCKAGGGAERWERRLRVKLGLPGSSPGPPCIAARASATSSLSPKRAWQEEGGASAPTEHPLLPYRLQQFIQDLDSFLTWLVKTQAAVASEELPCHLAGAERLLNHHASLKEEINRYEEDYAKIQAVNDVLALEEAELPYLSLQQWLQKLDIGWNKLLEMWENRREMLVQAHIFFLFLRDAKQAEICLYNQVGLAGSSPDSPESGARCSWGQPKHLPMWILPPAWGLVWRPFSPQLLWMWLAQFLATPQGGAEPLHGGGSLQGMWLQHLMLLAEGCGGGGDGGGGDLLKHHHPHLKP